MSRDFDLVLVPYQDIDAPEQTDCLVTDVVAGPKWAGLRQILREWDGWRAYEHIWLPDDDIAATPETIDAMFAVAGGVGLDLFAPALHRSSYFAHFSTMENTRLYGRWVGFVEIMVPGFSRPALERLLPTLDETETGWGWGLDSVWPKLLGYENVGIIDATPVVHTRPVGRMRDEQLAQRVLAESDRLLAGYDCRQNHTTFGAFGRNLRRLELSDQELLGEVLRGSHYLLDTDRRIGRWITEFQSGRAPDDYPVAGTPGSVATAPQSAAA